MIKEVVVILHSLYTDVATWHKDLGGSKYCYNRIFEKATIMHLPSVSVMS